MFFSAAYDLENTWSARVNPKGALGPDKCLCLPHNGGVIHDKNGETGRSKLFKFVEDAEIDAFYT